MATPVSMPSIGEPSCDEIVKTRRLYFLFPFLIGVIFFTLFQILDKHPNLIDFDPLSSTISTFCLFDLVTLLRANLELSAILGHMGEMCFNLAVLMQAIISSASLIFLVYLVTFTTPPTNAAVKNSTNKKCWRPRSSSSARFCFAQHIFHLEDIRQISLISMDFTFSAKGSYSRSVIIIYTF